MVVAIVSSSQDLSGSRLPEDEALVVHVSAVLDQHGRLDDAGPGRLEARPLVAHTTPWPEIGAPAHASRQCIALSCAKTDAGSSRVAPDSREGAGETAEESG